LKIAARRVDAPGQCVQDRDRPVGLRRIALLLEPGPGVMRHRPILPQHSRRLADRVRIDTRNLGSGLGRHRAALRGIKSEGRPAGDRPLTAGDHEGPG
jgi:hypothetical protein